jgi:hypothetical protein
MTRTAAVAPGRRKLPEKMSSCFLIHKDKKYVVAVKD